jgi:septal ring factor EnvC (AmiA/AmiB activator)
MARFVLIVGVVCALLAAVLGFYNRAKFLRMRTELAGTREGLRKAGDEIQRLNARNLATQKAFANQAQANQQDRDKLTTQMNEAVAQAKQLRDQLAAKDNENKGLTTALAEAGQKMNQREQTEADRDRLANRLLEVETAYNQLLLQQAHAKPSPSPPILEGTILSINREAKAMTVSVGSSVGLTVNSRLTLAKSDDKFGRLRVVSVEKNSCVAQFVSNEAENIGRVAVGDAVTFRK